MAISTALRGFSDLGRAVTPVFLLMDHFLYQFSAFSEKMKKIYRLDFCKMHDRVPFFLALRSSVRRFQMPFKGLSFVKTLVKLELFTQQTHFYKIRLSSFASVDSPSIFSTINHCRPCWITCANLSKLGYFSTRFISETKTVTPIFFAFLAQVTHYLTAVKISKNSIEWKIFARTSLRPNSANSHSFLVAPKSTFALLYLPFLKKPIRKRCYCCSMASKHYQPIRWSVLLSFGEAIWNAFYTRHVRTLPSVVSVYIFFAKW